MKYPVKRIVSTAAAAVALAVVIPVGSAAAINRTDCGNSTEFAKIENYNSTQSLCFANTGEQYVQIYDVNNVTAGNNHVEVTLGGHTYDLDKGQSIEDVEGLNQELTWIKIY